MRHSNRPPSKIFLLLSFAAGVLVVTALTAYFFVTFSRLELEKYKNSLRNRGELLDLKDLNIEVVPDAEKRAKALINISETVVQIARSQKIADVSPPSQPLHGPRAVFHKQEQIYSGTKPLSWEEASRSLEKLEPHLSDIVELSADGPIELHPDYGLGTMPFGISDGTSYTTY